MRTEHLSVLASLAKVAANLSDIAEVIDTDMRALSGDGDEDATDLADLADIYAGTPLTSKPDALPAILSRAQCLLADLEALRTHPIW